MNTADGTPPDRSGRVRAQVNSTDTPSWELVFGARSARARHRFAVTPSDTPRSNRSIRRLVTASSAAARVRSRATASVVVACRSNGGAAAGPSPASSGVTRDNTVTT